MQPNTLLSTAAVLLSLLLPAAASAAEDPPAASIAAGGSDLAKEQRWRDQIVDSLMDGDAVDLSAGDLGFLSLYAEADEDTGRGAVIVHGIGVHPNWPQVVYPLRTGLPARGGVPLSGWRRSGDGLATPHGDVHTREVFESGIGIETQHGFQRVGIDDPFGDQLGPQRPAEGCRQLACHR